MSSHLKAELAATCSTLGRLHKGEYLIEPDCIESVKDLIRFLKRDDESHEIRKFLGESKVLQNDLVHILKTSAEENSDLFDVTLRLLINLTTPTMLLFRDEIPAQKIGRNIFISLTGYSQSYKIAFCDIDFWSKVCGKLTDLFEIDWAERSADDGIKIERILLLLRNVLQIPADVDSEKRPENDTTVHDKVLWALKQSQMLELLLFLSTNRNEEQYFLNLLEIFSLVLREQNPKVLAQCDIQRSRIEKTKDTEDLMKAREFEKHSRNKYRNVRNFNATLVMRGVKSLSNNDVVCHKFLDEANVLKPNRVGKKQVRSKKNCVPVESERPERRSAFSVRLFLKEFCVEFLNCSFCSLMTVVKNKLVCGKSLANDQSYYFWVLKFFLEFAVFSNVDVTLIQDLMITETFHFVQMSMNDAFEHFVVDKKKTRDWIRRIHLLLKAYRSLLETLLWMDRSKNALARSISREIKSHIFLITEYREMTLHILLRYDSAKFSMSYLRDIVETAHLFLKLLEEYTRETKLVVQEVVRKKSKGKKNRKVKKSREMKWEKIKDVVYDALCSENQFPEIPPFDATLEIPVDDQKGRAMKKIQELLHLGKIKDGIGLFRSARQVWPENESFGSKEMSVEDETLALQEICIADLCDIDCGKVFPMYRNKKFDSEDDEEKEDSDDQVNVIEKDFDIMDYKKRLVNKKIIEGCGNLLKNYQKNSNHTNHCIVKLLYRVGWECCMPAMLYQASLFWTLLKILQDKSQKYNEINTFTMNLLRRFRKHASKHPVVFLDLLFWKDYKVALEIQHGYEVYPDEQKGAKHKKKSIGIEKETKSCAENEICGELPRNTRNKKTKKQELPPNSSSSSERHVDYMKKDENESSVNHNSGSSRILFSNYSDSGEEQVGTNSRNKYCKTDVHARTCTHEKSNESVEKQSGYNKFSDNEENIDSQADLSPRLKPRRRIIKNNEYDDTSTVYYPKNSSIRTFPLFGHHKTKKRPKSKSKNLNPDKSNELGASSQKSNASLKKRARQSKNKRDFQLFEEDAEESSHSQSKRVRYISSDTENNQSEEEFIPVKRKRCSKSAVIDSDSDVEPVEEDTTS